MLDSFYCYHYFGGGGVNLGDERLKAANYLHDLCEKSQYILNELYFDSDLPDSILLPLQEVMGEAATVINKLLLRDDKELDSLTDYKFLVARKSPWFSDLLVELHSDNRDLLMTVIGAASIARSLANGEIIEEGEYNVLFFVLLAIESSTNKYLIMFEDFSGELIEDGVIEEDGDE